MIYKSGTNYFDLVKLNIIDILMDLNLLKCNRDYTKFIILGRGRTGSTFLRGLLNSHSKILTFGELFRDHYSIGWDFPFCDNYMNSGKIISLYQHDPITFLENKIFKAYKNDVSAVGFKLFHYHAKNHKHNEIWDYLNGLDNLKIIHLQRKNTLRMILSEKKAFKTERWANINGEEEPKVNLELDYEECLYRFEFEKKAAVELNSFFNDSIILDLYYEDLLNKQQTETNRVLDFLNITYQELKPLTHRQANQPLKDAISNYYDLKNKFSNTQWENFFED